MNMLKKEWKSIVIIVWLAGISLFLVNMSQKIDQLHAQSYKIDDTLKTVEGVIIGTDSGVLDINKRLERMATHINSIEKRVRRR
jgi:Na+-transporting NADH:ubiquinone oxidoreductase subunit NqrD